MENETNMSDVQDYLDDFWDTFSAEEKAQLTADGYKTRNWGVLYVVDFTTRKLIARKDQE